MYYYSFPKSADATIYTGGKCVSAGSKFHVFTGPLNQQSDLFTIRNLYFCGTEEIIGLERFLLIQRLLE